MHTTEPRRLSGQGRITLLTKEKLYSFLYVQLGMVYMWVFSMIITASFRNGSRESFRIFYTVYSIIASNFFFLFPSKREIPYKNIFVIIRHRPKIIANRFYTTVKINPLVVEMKMIVVQCDVSFSSRLQEHNGFM